MKDMHHYLSNNATKQAIRNIKHLAMHLNPQLADESKGQKKTEKLIISSYKIHQRGNVTG